MSQSAVIAAAATGGQIPLIGGLSCFQANQAGEKNKIIKFIYTRINFLLRLLGVAQAMAQQNQMSQSFYNLQVTLKNSKNLIV